MGELQQELSFFVIHDCLFSTIKLIICLGPVLPRFSLHFEVEQ